MASIEQQNDGILSIGLMGKDAGKLQAGGGNIDLTLSNMSKVVGDLRAVSFQVSNLMDGDQGRARMTYVNTGVYSGNKDAMKTSMDIFNGDKDLIFDLKGKHYGRAGDKETNDTSTIHLNWEAGQLDNGRMDNNQLAQYTGFMAKEGNLLDRIVKNDEWVKEDKLLAEGSTEEVMKMRYAREQKSFEVTDDVLNSLEKNMGIKMNDSDLRGSIAHAASGDLSEWDWDSSGNDAKKRVKVNGVEREIDIDSPFNKKIKPTSAFGIRWLSGKLQVHPGNDFTSNDKKVYMLLEGKEGKISKINRTNRNQDGGLSVYIDVTLDDDSKIQVRMHHFKSIDSSLKKGDSVAMGDYIGEYGNSGMKNSNGTWKSAGQGGDHLDIQVTSKTKNEFMKQLIIDNGGDPYYDEFYSKKTGLYYYNVSYLLPEDEFKKENYPESSYKDGYKQALTKYPSERTTSSSNKIKKNLKTGYKGKREFQ